eukprot:PhM_4_TR5964/c0_g1_i1/m.3879
MYHHRSLLLHNRGAVCARRTLLSTLPTSASSRMATRGSAFAQVSSGMFNRSRVLLCAAGDVAASEFCKFAEFDIPKENNVKTLIGNGDEWIAQEKVHGANFGVHVFNSGKTIKYAKRSGFIHDNEHFFGFTKLIPEWEKQVPVMYESMVAKFGEVDAIVMNGELFGGKYVHPDLPVKEYYAEFRGQQRRISAIQTDFFPQYSPDIHFFAFDLKYRTGPAGEWINLTPDEALDIFAKMPGLLYAKPIVRGPLEKVLSFDMDSYETVLPHILGFGNYIMPGNFGEGLVVRNAKRGGPVEGLAKSTILKFKHKLFQESRHSEKVGSRDAMQELRQSIIKKRGETLIDPEAFMTQKEIETLKVLLDMICENRLQSVISKYGLDVFDKNSALPASERKSQWDLVTLLAKDAWKDWLKEATEDELKYSHFLKRHYANYLRAEAEKFVASRWGDVSKGSFS